MSSDVVLTAAMRNNLLSLQNTQRMIDTVQLRLATGLKVNSALDNPQSFFTSQSLNNRASDLGRLLDSIGQSIRTIEEADTGVTAMSKLLTQAQAITQSARDTLAASEGEARALGNVDLRNVADLTTLGITTGDQFTISTIDNNGNVASEVITIVTGDTAASLAAKITNAFADDGNDKIIKASVTGEGFLSIESIDGRSFRIEDGVSTATTVIGAAGFQALGLGDYFTTENFNNAGAAGTRQAATIVAGNTLTSITMYESTADLAEAGDTIVGNTFRDSSGNTLMGGFAAGNIMNFSVRTESGTQNVNVTLTANTSFQNVVDAINQNVNVKDLIQANFNSATGQLSFTSLSDQVQTFTIGATTAGNAATFDLGFGDPTGKLDPMVTATAIPQSRSFSFNSSTQALDALAKDYNTIRQQIDDLAGKDANYRGINLLNGDNLTTYFNEDNTSKLVTEGANFTANGLGLTEATFRSGSAIELSATQTRQALNEVRSFGSSLSNNLSIIQTRRDFTESTITTLKAGATDLVGADDNEEGANLLALQTRQALGVTSLSLASQSQQSVLRLF